MLERPSTLSGTKIADLSIFKFSIGLGGMSGWGSKYLRQDRYFLETIIVCIGGGGKWRYGGVRDVGERWREGVDRELCERTKISDQAQVCSTIPHETVLIECVIRNVCNQARIYRCYNWKMYIHSHARSIDPKPKQEQTRRTGTFHVMCYQRFVYETEINHVYWWKWNFYLCSLCWRTCSLIHLRPAAIPQTPIGRLWGSFSLYWSQQ